MIYDLSLSWRGLRTRPVQTLIPMLVVGLAVALSIAVLALGDAARRGIIQASDPFGVLVIGPKGDGQQLVLNEFRGRPRQPRRLAAQPEHRQSVSRGAWYRANAGVRPA
jgi:hypothetical protein